ncbi:MAG: HTTM domain-containing protein [Gemmataceae bacterium]|nr:HTTM domain-containing protein [Gemmataceae bacterium]
MLASTAAAKKPMWRQAWDAWNAFWFTPRDPLVLAAIRVLTGALTLYTLIAYSFTLSDFAGPEGWIDQKYCDEQLYERPYQVPPLSGHENPSRPPASLEEEKYFKDYLDKFGEWPLPPFPKTPIELKYCDDFRYQYGIDLRLLGLPPPKNEKEWSFLVQYFETYRVPMPPPYPESVDEMKKIHDHIERFGVDPRRVYARGASTFSVYFHIHDPFWRSTVHGLFLVVVLLFTLGLGTRVTSVLAWFAYLNYVHRNHTVLFGADQMIVILLTYLAIGPSGAALSLDRWLSRWWNGRGQGDDGVSPPLPTISANVAIRLLQVHLCIIYGIAGLSKLQGPAWWNGTALWNVLANFEFAPMNWAVYDWLLRTVGSNQLIFEILLTGGAYFTLAFEISYPFVVWNPNGRWVMLASAILLHGVIGLFMGLQTFALIMLVMNMAFLHPEEVRAVIA